MSESVCCVMYLKYLIDSLSILSYISISYLSEWLNFSIIVRLDNIGNTFSDQEIFIILAVKH